MQAARHLTLEPALRNSNAWSWPWRSHHGSRPSLACRYCSPSLPRATGSSLARTSVKPLTRTVAYGALSRKCHLLPQARARLASNRDVRGQVRSQCNTSTLAHLRAQALPYLQLARMDKPIGSWLLFWPCAWSITLASHALAVPPGVTAYNLVLFGVGAFVMRGAGCTINDMWDARMDRLVERTKHRPIASGAVTHFQALVFLGAQLSAGLAVLLNLNWYSIVLGASSLGVVVIYPLMKRITYWPQFVLGLAFNWGAMLGWSAVAGSCEWGVVLPLYAGSVAWTLVYDTIYAHQDKTDDVTAGVKSTALLFGNRTKPVLSAFSAMFLSSTAYAVFAVPGKALVPVSISQALSSMFPGSIALGLAGHPFFASALACSALHLAWQIKTVALDDRADCWHKFESNQRLGLIIWLGLAADYFVLFWFHTSL